MRDILPAIRSQSIVGLKSWGIYPDWGKVGKGVPQGEYTPHGCKDGLSHNGRARLPFEQARVTRKEAILRMRMAVCSTFPLHASGNGVRCTIRVANILCLSSRHHSA